MSDGWTDIQGKCVLNVMFATPEAIFLKAIAAQSSCHTSEYIANLLSEEMESADSSRVQVLEM